MPRRLVAAPRSPAPLASARYIDIEDAAELRGCSQAEARALARTESWLTKYEGGEVLYYLLDIERASGGRP